MDIDQTTRIGADGLRHAMDDPDFPTDASLFNSQVIAVKGEPTEGQVATPDDLGTGYHWADPGGDSPDLPDGVYVQDSEPAEPNDGDIWVDTA